MKKGLSIVLALMAALTLAISCTKEGATFLNEQIVDGELRMEIGNIVELQLPLGSVVDEWTSSNPEVASVSNGFISAISVGTTDVKAKGKGIRASVRVIVSAAKITAFSIPEKVTGYVTREIEIPVTGMEPSNADARSIEWHIDPMDVLEIVSVESDKLIVKGKSTGKAEVMAKGFGCDGNCVVEVLAPQLSITPSPVSLAAGETVKLELHQNPVVFGDITWSCDNNYVTVDSEGNVTAGNVSGTSRVSAGCGNYFASAEVTVLGSDYQIKLTNVYEPQSGLAGLSSVTLVPYTYMMGCTCTAYDSSTGQEISYGWQDYSAKVYARDGNGNRLPNRIVQSLKWSVTGTGDRNTKINDGKDEAALGRSELLTSPWTLKVEGLFDVSASLQVKTGFTKIYLYSGTSAETYSKWKRVISGDPGSTITPPSKSSVFVVMEDDSGNIYVTGRLKLETISSSGTPSAYVSGRKWSSSFPDSTVPYISVSSGSSSWSAKFKVTILPRKTDDNTPLGYFYLQY